jgi:nucleotide-binding universal stress UspA family protein
MSAYIIRPVVVGVDGSPASRAAVRFAAAEADARDRTLRIVHATAWPSGAAPRASASAEQIIVEAIDLAEAEFPGLAVDAHVVFGTPAAVLLDEAHHAALVVVGRGGFAGLPAGSTSTQLATRSRKPVVVVRGEVPPPDAPVLVGIDPGDPAGGAIEFAFEEAVLRTAPLRALFAWSVARVLGDAGRLAAIRGIEDATQEANRQLNEVLAVWQEKYPGVRVVPDAEYMLDPANALVRASCQAALTVVGSHRRGEGRELALSSCVDQLVHRAMSPVAVVPT